MNISIWIMFAYNVEHDGINAYRYMNIDIAHIEDYTIASYTRDTI